MSGAVDRASRWLYRGVWSVLVDLFRVPDRPPTLPVSVGDDVRSFRPAEGFLRYLKFVFWLLFLLIDGALLIIWLAIFSQSKLVALILAVPFLVIMVLPDIVAYIGIHLRYDTTWYVLTNRSVRIRRGIWLINETTITFENVQNVTINQGPLQRYFGIADVRIKTAGGGAAGPHGSSDAHTGRIEGVDNAVAIRDLIMDRVRASKSAGLGDERSRSHHPHEAVGALSSQAIALLREIRDLARSVSDAAA